MVAESLISTLGGSLIGGIFRCIPEFLKFFDAKNERKHELAMQDKAIEFRKVEGSIKLDEIVAQDQANYNDKAMEALVSAVAGQDKITGVKWIDGFSHLMRPLITLQWVILLYPAVIMAGFFIAINSGTNALEALVKVFGLEEKALVGAIVNFWFLDRVFKSVKVGLK